MIPDHLTQISIVILSIWVVTVARNAEVDIPEKLIAPLEAQADGALNFVATPLHCTAGVTVKLPLGAAFTVPLTATFWL